MSPKHQVDWRGIDDPTFREIVGDRLDTIMDWMEANSEALKNHAERCPIVVNSRRALIGIAAVFGTLLVGGIAWALWIGVGALLRGAP